MKNILEIEIKVGGMGSPHCALRVKNALESLDAVDGAITNHETGLATIKYDGDNIGVSELKETINNAGYQAL